MARIIILNGSPRKKGSTASLIRSFREGAESAGNEVTEFYLNGMNIHPCIGCQRCRSGADPCAFKDDMGSIYRAFLECDVVVFASPMYWWTIDAQLLTAVDRLYALHSVYGIDKLKRKSVLIMTAGGDWYENPVQWYSMFEKAIGWTDLGMILGAGKEKEAKLLGASIS